MTGILNVLVGFLSGVGEAVDEYFQYVTLLLHGDGTNGAQNNTFLDSSTNNFTITRNGNTTQGTFSPFSKPDGAWGNYFDGSGDFLTAPSNAAFQFGSGDFTMELSVYAATNSFGEKTFLQYGLATVTGWTEVSWGFGTDASGNPFFQVSNGVNNPQFTLTSSVALTAFSWNHIAIVRSGNDFTLYLNGTSVGTTTSSFSLYDPGASSLFHIGRAHNNATSRDWPGYISNVRVVKGTAVYTGAFTPSTTPLTAITNTSLLTCQSNRFIDNSSNNFTITRNGDVKVTPFSPFPITTAYSTSVNGGAGYFDGSGDYLDVSSDSNLTIGTNDFTISMWVYFDALPATAANVFEGRPSTSANALTPAIAYSTTSNNWIYVVNGSTVINGSVATTGQWYYLVVSRLSGTTRMFLNGSQIGSDYSDTNDYVAFAADRPRIGDRGNSSGTGTPLDGYISGLEVLIGTGYSSVTVPAAPPSPTANTELLLNFTNGGIFDNTCFNTLETVGNAQIDTTTKKYGTGSMEFDGTGDYLALPGSDAFILGSGNFTVEGWAYFTTIGGASVGRGLFQMSGTAGGFTTTLTTTAAVGSRASDGKWELYGGGGATAAASATPSTNTWYHFALVKNGSNLTLYIDGVSTISKTDNTNYTGQYLVIGGYYTTTDVMAGFIDDLRITKGIARYTTTFTPPTEAFPNIGS